MVAGSDIAPDTGSARYEHQCLVEEARALLSDEAAYGHLAEFFGALADTTRAKIVHLLSQQELCTSDIASVVGITESGVSQHLRVLRSLGIVTSRRAGKYVYYALDDEHVVLLVRVGLAHESHKSGARLAAVIDTGGREAY